MRTTIYLDELGIRIQSCGPCPSQKKSDYTIMILDSYSDVVNSSNFEYESSPIRGATALDEERSSFVEASPRGDSFVKRKDN